MPSPLRKFGSFLGLLEDEFYEEADVAEVVTREPRLREVAATTREPRGRHTRESRSHDREVRTSSENRAQIHAVQAPFVAAPAQIVNVTPRSFNDARQIGEEFRSGHAIIMNLVDLDEVNSRRLIDYASGLTHALDGKIERISRGVFVLSPKNMDMREAAHVSLVNDAFFNQS